MWPSFGWAIILLILSGYPGNRLPKIRLWGPFGFDKLVHVGIYLVFAYLLALGFVKQTKNLRLHANGKTFAVIIAVSYGIFMEFLQFTIFINRSAELGDVIADLVGAIFGILLFTITLEKKISRKPLNL